ncbi:MAG: hypothetical protein WC966_06800 [Bradymonadales bacterium]
MKRFVFCIASMVFIFSLSAVASAQVPSFCFKKNGKLNCKNPHCAPYCYDNNDDFRGRDKKSKKKHKRDREVVVVHEHVHHPAPEPVIAPPPVIEVRPPAVVLQPPAVVVHDPGYPAVLSSPDFYEAEIHRLQQANVDLKESLEIERVRVEREYQNCRYWYRYNSKMCYRDDVRLKRIDRQISSNKREIERNKDLQRRALRARGMR